MTVSKNLDERSRYIIEQLMKDGRTKYTAIAKKLGITPAAVKERVERMIDKGIIKVSALVNIEMFFPVTAVVGIEGDADAIKTLTRRFENCPLVFHMARTSGMHNLVVSIAGEDLNSVEKFLSNHIRNEAGVRHVEVNIGNSPHHPKFAQLKIGYVKALSSCPCGMGCDKCPSYDDKSCRGCPVTKFYRKDNSSK